ncbi:MAG: OmcA/MtrC family decaheme c-type cytochrome, partial [Dehalococcoidia bacterium]|nr:OmcA/MtrC family decaheme c-type cytochrome [Dehalococcoidia bacterium]
SYTKRRYLMGRVRGIYLPAILAVVAALLTFPWWGSHVQSILAADAPGPGLKVQITDVSIPGDRKPVVTFRITNAEGNPLQLTDLDGGLVRFTIARIDIDPATGLTSYFNYVMINAPGRPFVFKGQTMQPALASAVQPASAMDPGGSVVGLGNGVHKYTFGTVLPENYPRDASHAVGVQATRDTRTFAGNDVFYFVPQGGTPPVQRQVVNVENCNRCHNPLALHGGSRRDTRLCVLCHTPQNMDPESGNTPDFKVMVHKIHRGANLPSVQAGTPYFIVGNSQNVFDFSDVACPQDVRNCTTCHTNAPQADNWKNAPNAAACTSCHDNVNPLTGQNHGGGVQTNATCKNCHTNTMVSEFDLSVPGSHLIPVKSSQLRGVNFDLVSVSDTKPGQNPTVVFTIKDKDGKAIAPSEMSSLSLVLAGPTTDYQTEPVVSLSAIDATPVVDGAYSYTFGVPVPDDASGTFAVGIQGYISTTIKGPGGNPLTGVRDAGFNKVAYAAVTDATPMPRKKIVALENCNRCHQELGSPAGLSIHGGTRRNTEFCVLCHNSNHNGTGIGGAPVAVRFGQFIHRIHTGEEGSEPFVVRGLDFSEVRFPGDRRDCEKCHLPGSNLIDFLHYGAQPTIVRQPITPATTTTRHVVNTTAPVVSITPPIQAACLGCHDSQKAKQHAALQTTPEGAETCIICHGEGRDFAVSKVHARP